MPETTVYARNNVLFVQLKFSRFFCNLVALTLGWSCVKDLRVTNMDNGIMTGFGEGQEENIFPRDSHGQGIWDKH